MQADEWVVLSARESIVVQPKLKLGPEDRKHVPDQLLRKYLANLEFTGRGRAESLTRDHPLIDGDLVGGADRAEASARGLLQDHAPGDAPREDQQTPIVKLPPFPEVLRRGGLRLDF